MDYSQYFPPNLIDRMTHLHDVLQEVLPTDGLDAWIGGFVGEIRPENEVRIFEAIAVVYSDVLKSVDSTLKQRQRLYTTLVIAASGMVVPGIEDGLPVGTPGYDELYRRFTEAFALNERPDRQIDFNF
jgi:hypothetical protein